MSRDYGHPDEKGDPERKCPSNAVGYRVRKDVSDVDGSMEIGNAIGRGRRRSFAEAYTKHYIPRIYIYILLYTKTVIFYK